MTHEPVAYQIEDANGEFMCLSRTKSTVRGVTSKPLYDESALHAEIARLTDENEALRSGCKPLTSEQKNAIFQSRAGANDHGVPYLRCYREGFEHIVADIEAAHGIGGNP